VTAHDGFTLHDLVSYNQKHNESNQEANRDGQDNNYSWNCGFEGPTDNPGIVRLREQQMRNLLATLLLSQGLPMLLGGDEFGRTQLGNNNAYCQDNETTWLDWEGIDEAGEALIAFTRKLIQLRRDHIVFHRSRFYHGREIPGTTIKDVVWLKPDGSEMREADWRAGDARSLALLLSGEAGVYHLTGQGEKEPDDTFMLILNASDAAVEYRLPEIGTLSRPAMLIDTARFDAVIDEELPVANPYTVGARALVVISYRREQ
jgi:isoamylase